MRSVAGQIQLSASDVVGHPHCHDLTVLDMRAAKGEISKPVIWDPVLEQACPPYYQTW